MRVLLVDGQAGESDAAEQVLRDAGHEVHRCVEAHGPSFPCNGMATGDCPVEDGQLDAAVLVRNELGDVRTPREDGARCALRRHIPLVLAGQVDESPYNEWATELAEDLADLPAALERSAAGLLQRHSRAARRSLQAVLVGHDVPADHADAAVTRHGAELRVTLRPGVPLTKEVADAAAVRAAGAVRDVDPYASKVDVAVEAPD